MLWSGLGSLTGANRPVCCVSPSKVLSYNYLLETGGEGRERRGREKRRRKGKGWRGKGRIDLC